MRHLKAYEIARAWRRNEHEENLKLIPDATHLVEGWAALVKFTGYNIEAARRQIKLYGFPEPKFYYRQKTDHSKRRENVWRRVAYWDKREIGDWVKRSSGGINDL